MAWTKEDYKKFREGFTGKKEKSEQSSGQDQSREARMKRAASRAKKKAEGKY